MNAEHMKRVMTPRQAKILGTQDVPYGSTLLDSPGVTALVDKGMLNGNMEHIQSCARNTECSFRGDVVAKKLDEREKEKLAEACSSCGKTASEAGLARLLRCSACTIGPLYCGAECQKGSCVSLTVLRQLCPQI